MNTLISSTTSVLLIASTIPKLTHRLELVYQNVLQFPIFSTKTVYAFKTVQMAFTLMPWQEIVSAIAQMAPSLTNLPTLALLSAQQNQCYTLIVSQVTASPAVSTWIDSLITWLGHVSSTAPMEPLPTSQQDHADLLAQLAITVSIALFDAN